MSEFNPFNPPLDRDKRQLATRPLSSPFSFRMGSPLVTPVRPMPRLPQVMTPPKTPAPVGLKPALLPQLKPRNVFYSFHYADIYRVNNVRHTEQFRARISEVPQSHYDRSLWETSKRTDPESLKRLIREGIENTSVVCVLVGTDTWERRWVRYEIARSVVDGKGLLAVDINSIPHHKTRSVEHRGINPLAMMGVGAMADGTFRLYEKVLEQRYGRWDFVWRPYQDYRANVPLPNYLVKPSVGYVVSLDKGARRYDAVADGVWANMAAWLNVAVMDAGRT